MNKSFLEGPILTIQLIERKINVYPHIASQCGYLDHITPDEIVFYDRSINEEAIFIEWMEYCVNKEHPNKSLEKIETFDKFISNVCSRLVLLPTLRFILPIENNILDDLWSLVIQHISDKYKGNTLCEEDYLLSVRSYLDCFEQHIVDFNPHIKEEYMLSLIKVVLSAFKLVVFTFTSPKRNDHGPVDTSRKVEDVLKLLNIPFNSVEYPQTYYRDEYGCIIDTNSYFKIDGEVFDVKMHSNMGVTSDCKRASLNLVDYLSNKWYSLVIADQ